jgi:murein DD-endopeptidase MepM/ murein hydrolase activator NlpD
MPDRVKTNLNKTIKSKFRFVVLNDATFEEKFSLVLSRTNVWVFLSTVAFVLIVLTASAIIYTPLKYYIPGFGDYNYRSQIISLSLRTDSLESLLLAKNLKIGSVENILNGNIDSMSNIDKSTKPITTDKNTPPEAASEQELQLRKEVEDIERFSINYRKDSKNDVRTILNEYHFLSPVAGIPTDDFNSSTEHFGIDIAAKSDEPVKATLDGVVIATTFDVETGYSIFVQHKDNLISVYKHNSKLFKSNGNFVKCGDVIASVGNSGTLSTGPHLHFEIWHQGKPLNPKDFIVF